MSVNSKMTAIADNIRAMTGLSGLIGLDDMAAYVGRANEGITMERDLINQIIAALEGKAAGGGSSVQTAEGQITPENYKATIDCGFLPNAIFFDFGYANGAYLVAGTVIYQGRSSMAMGTSTGGTDCIMFLVSPTDGSDFGLDIMFAGIDLTTGENFDVTWEIPWMAVKFI